MKRNILLLSIFYFIGFTSFAKVWQVGPTRTYKVPSDVSGLVSDGDTVEIDAGTYTDCTTWTNNNLLLEGVGGTGLTYVHLQNSVCGLKGIWNFEPPAQNITVERIEFSGASISGSDGGNGAGIRSQGGSFTIRYCYFHDNQDGILSNTAAGNDSTDVLIENSEFAYNGCAVGDSSGCDPGYEHNMYIGSGTRSFIIMYSYIHGAIQGHNIKTRADNNYILYNRIMDQTDGTSSYDIDIAQGGPTVIMGNLIEGGPMKVNHSIICYNEGSTNPGPLNLLLVNNTVVNDQTTGYFLFMPKTGNDTLTLINNIFAGPGSLFNGATNFSVIDSTHNWQPSNVDSVGLVNATAYNYNLTSTSPAINKGTNAGYVYNIFPYDSFSLTPVYEYLDTASEEPRPVVGIIDLGAYEYSAATSISTISSSDDFLMKIYPAPASSELTVAINNSQNKPVVLTMFDVTGRKVMSFTTSKILQTINTVSLAPGIYMLKALIGNSFVTSKVVIAK